MTARLVHRYVHSPALLAGLAGNAQLLPNHNIFVGWGGAPDFSEYSPTGHQIFNGSFALGVGTYRAFRFNWTGEPATPPAVARATGPGGAVTLYVSWNGATRVVRWRVLGGGRRHSLRPLRTVSRSGFETAIRLDRPPSYLRVLALASRGQTLGATRLRAG